MLGKEKSDSEGFDTLRAEPNGFLVHHLNHSVTLSMSFLMLGMCDGVVLLMKEKCGK